MEAGWGTEPIAWRIKWFMEDITKTDSPIAVIHSTSYWWDWEQAAQYAVDTRISHVDAKNPVIYFGPTREDYVEEL
jgi:hypothetical protein